MANVCFGRSKNLREFRSRRPDLRSPIAIRVSSVTECSVAANELKRMFEEEITMKKGRR